MIKRSQRKLAPVTLFDDLAQSYEGWFETRVGRYVDYQEKKLILGLMEATAADRVLEVGAGTGHYLKEIAKSGARCIGVEPSAAMLAVAVGRSPHADYIRGVGEQLPFAGNSFDALLYMTTLEFVQDAGAAVREAARVVRPGGRLVFGVLNAAGPWAASRGQEGGFWNQARFYTGAELEAMLEPLGPVEVAYCVHVPPALAARLPAPLLRVVDWIFARVRGRGGALVGAVVTLRSRP